MQIPLRKDNRGLGFLLAAGLILAGARTGYAQDVVPSGVGDSLPAANEAAPGELPAALSSFVYDNSTDADAREKYMHDDAEDGMTPFETFSHSWYQHDEIPEEEPSLFWKLGDGAAHILEGPLEPLTNLFGTIHDAEHFETHSHIDDHYREPIDIFPRVPLPIEWNEKYLGQEFLKQGVELPTGAVWRAGLWIFGTNRFAVQYRDEQLNGVNFNEIVNRLDMFAFLNLTGTEHLVVAYRPFDEETGRQLLPGREFTSYDIKNGVSLDGLNTNIQSLFFEGDIGEIFPYWDPYDFNLTDWRFSVGRQPMSFQRGIMMNEDLIDAVTLTRNTLNGGGNLNLRATAFFAWNNVTRIQPGNPNFTNANSDAKIYGMFTESDFAFNTLNIDFAYLEDQNVMGDMWSWGISSTQRLVGFENTYNTRFHVIGSYAPDGENGGAGTGTILFSQLSWTPHHSFDLIYLNSYWTIDQYTSLSRGPLMGGPLGDVGLLFASAAIGRFGPTIPNTTQSEAGAGLGYQMFYDDRRKQMIAEIGGKKSTTGVDDGQIGIFLRSQSAFGQHVILVIDALAAVRENRDGVSTGTRMEILYTF